MSTSISPVNRTRSQKLNGGRVRCVVYLPKAEAESINKIASLKGSSQSSIIAQFYFQGKTLINTHREED